MRVGAERGALEFHSYWGNARRAVHFGGFPRVPVSHQPEMATKQAKNQCLTMVLGQTGKTRFQPIFHLHLFPKPPNCSPKVSGKPGVSRWPKYASKRAKRTCLGTPSRPGSPMLDLFLVHEANKSPKRDRRRPEAEIQLHRCAWPSQRVEATTSGGLPRAKS